MMKYYIILIITFIITNNSLFPNGGPIDESFVRKSGHIKLIEKAEIDILSEKLDIKINGNYCDVEVQYVFKNNSGDDEWVEYGFPVDFFEPSSNYIKGKTDCNATALYWQDDYILDFEMKFENQIKKYYNKIDPETFNDTVNPSEEYGDMAVELARKWYISNLYFRKGASKTLNVKYRIKTTYSDASYTKSYYPVYSKRVFNYDFTPAKYWGKGIAKDFEVRIDAKEIFDSNGEIEIKGLGRLIKKKGIYTYKSKNFNFHVASPLKITYDNSNIMINKFIYDSFLDDDFYKNIKVRSSNPKVNTKALFDKNYTKTGLVLKKGDWIELSFPARHIDFGVFALVIGNTQSREKYYSNARLKNLDYKLIYTEYRYNDTIPRIDSLSSEDFSWTIKDNSYDIFNPKFIYPFLTEIHNSGFHIIIPQKLRITIKDIYPGKKTKDIYIQEIIILGKEI